MQNNNQWHAKWYSQDKHGSAWERVKDAFKRDWEQTKNDVGAGGKDLDQDVGDTVKQAAGKEAIPAGNQPNPKPTQKPDWDGVAPAYEYGFEARQEYGTRYNQWDDSLEKELANEWKSNDKARAWEEVKPYVRKGYEHKS